MKILLDECIDRRFAIEFPEHEVKTVPQMGWAGVTSGSLMALAEGAFDVFVTVDRNLSFQRNLPDYNVAGSRGFAPCNFGLIDDLIIVCPSGPISPKGGE